MWYVRSFFPIHGQNIKDFFYSTKKNLFYAKLLHIIVFSKLLNRLIVYIITLPYILTYWILYKSVLVYIYTVIVGESFQKIAEN